MPHTSKKPSTASCILHPVSCLLSIAIQIPVKLLKNGMAKKTEKFLTQKKNSILLSFLPWGKKGKGAE
jgi:hypothetical protein